MKAAGDEAKTDGFKVRRIDVNGEIHVDAKVRSVTCFIADFRENQPKTVPFSFVSVANVQITGIASLEPE